MLYEPLRFADSPNTTRPASALAKLPERPAWESEPIISPASTRNIVEVVTEKSPLVGFAVCAPITLWTMYPVSISSIRRSRDNVLADDDSIKSLQPQSGGEVCPPRTADPVDFADENNGIVIGGDYSKPNENFKNKAITSDGGKTWTLVADGESPNYKSCVQYVPNTNGKEVFAVGKTGVSYSNDGGISWKEVSKEAYYTIQFVNSNIAWLSGNNKIGKLILP